MAMAISQLIISNNTNSQQNSSVSKIIFFQENKFNLDTSLTSQIIGYCQPLRIQT